MVVLRNGLWTALAASVAMYMCGYYNLPYGWVVLLLILILTLQGVVEWHIHNDRRIKEEIRERELLAAAAQLVNGLMMTGRWSREIAGGGDFDSVHWPKWARMINIHGASEIGSLKDRGELMEFTPILVETITGLAKSSCLRYRATGEMLDAAVKSLISVATDLYTSREQDITATRQTSRRARFQVVELMLTLVAPSRMQHGQFGKMLQEHGKPEALRDAIEKSKMEELVLGDAKPWRDDLLKFVLFRKADGTAPKADVE